MYAQVYIYIVHTRHNYNTYGGNMAVVVVVMAPTLMYKHQKVRKLNYYFRSGHNVPYIHRSKYHQPTCHEEYRMTHFQGHYSHCIVLYIHMYTYWDFHGNTVKLEYCMQTLTFSLAFNSSEFHVCKSCAKLIGHWNCMLSFWEKNYCKIWGC